MSKIKIIIDNKEYEIDSGKTILEVCRENKIEIPTLCHHPAIENYGACRLCVVEIERRGRKNLSTSCTYPTSDGMIINTKNDRVIKSRRMTLELLLTRCPDEKAIIDLAELYHIDKPRFKKQKDDCILCGLCVRMCEKINSNAILFVNRGYDRKIATPYDEYSEDCLTCGACSFICPTSHFALEKFKNNSGMLPIPNKSVYEVGLSKTGNISIFFTQAVPNIPVIDRENCIHYQNGGCNICEKVCSPQAIDYEQKDEVVEIDAGAIVIASGYEPYDADKLYKYGYKRFDNVITSLEFERILSASGPFGGQVLRLSDKIHPKKIAFLQCVGSRDEKNNAGYCSSVCCMYAIKEAVIAKEHAGKELETTIFYMDIRCFGKDFEKYYERAKDEYKVKFIKSKIYEVEEQKNTKNIIVKYCNQQGEVTSSEFDMVILSVGLKPSSDAVELCKKLNLSLNEYNFLSSPPFLPASTYKDGVFSCGVINGPKDIPESVIEASTAASYVNEFLYPAKKTLIKEKKYVEEIDISLFGNRIGVFICHCGTNIAGYIDVEDVKKYTEKLPNVVYVNKTLYTCSQDSLESMKQIIKEKKLTKVVVASCTPQTHEPLFQDTIREAGLNKYLFEMVNIRDQCSWVHMNNRQEATNKAKDLVFMAVCKAALLEPLQERKVDINDNALVIGGGVAGLNAALNLGNQGYKVYIIEKENELGGLAKKIKYTIDGQNVDEYLSFLIDKIKNNFQIEILLNSTVQSISGFVGNFNTTVINNSSGNTKNIEHGVIIVAVGADEYQPKEYLYNKNKNVLTQLKLEQILAEKDNAIKKWKEVVMIQCVGSREPEKPYCSRFCCQQAIKNALIIKKLNPECNVYILYRDIRTYGLSEEYYRTAREKGIVFIKYDVNKKPAVRQNDKKRLEVEVYEELVDKNIILEPDKVILSVGIEPHRENHELGKILKVPVNKDGNFLEAHVKLRPVEFATDGIFLAGICHSSKTIIESIAQGFAASSRACALLSNDYLVTQGVISRVNDNICNACGMCEDICPYKAIEVKEKEIGRTKIKTAIVNEIMCKGCGLCASICPSSAIDLYGFTNKEILEQIKAGV